MSIILSTLVKILLVHTRMHMHYATIAGIVGFRSRRAIARAASIDLANIHRMPTPEGYCILVFEALIEQGEENAPEIPGGPVDHLFSTLMTLRIVLILESLNLESFFSGRPYP